MKLCINCKYHTLVGNDSQNAQQHFCLYGVKPALSLVTGETLLPPSLLPCWVNRDATGPGTCGEEGKNFSPKKEQSEFDKRMDESIKAKLEEVVKADILPLKDAVYRKASEEVREFLKAAGVDPDAPLSERFDQIDRLIAQEEEELIGRPEITKADTSPYTGDKVMEVCATFSKGYLTLFLGFLDCEMKVDESEDCLETICCIEAFVEEVFSDEKLLNEVGLKTLNTLKENYFTLALLFSGWLEDSIERNGVYSMAYGAPKLKNISEKLLKLWKDNATQNMRQTSKPQNSIKIAPA